MGKTNGHGIEALAVRRATMADADKVRYRVYTSKTEYIAVIAESALMALRVAGVNEPYRIVRDLPTQGVAIAAERMVAGDSGQRVNLPTEKVAREVPVTPPPAPAASPGSQFVPMQLGDLDQKKGRTLRILSAKDMEALTRQPEPEPEVETAPSQAVEPVAQAPVERTPEPEPLPVESPELSPEQVQALLSE